MTVKKKKIDLILVTSDEESLVLSKYQYSYVKIACSDYKNLIKISNKIETYKLLEKIKSNSSLDWDKKRGEVMKAINNLRKWLDFVLNRQYQEVEETFT